jgi:outer membrane protein
MKKSLLFCLLFLFTATAVLKAQVFIGGGFNVRTGTNSENDKKLSSYNFSPVVGFDLTKKFALGIELGIGKEKNYEYNGAFYESNYSNWSIAPFARYYFVNAGEFSFFGQGTLGIGGGKSNSVKSFKIFESITPDIAYNLSKKFALEVGFGALQYVTTIYNDSDVAVSKWELGVGLDDLTFGLIFKL